jgi:hypothetical protein
MMVLFHSFSSFLLYWRLFTSWGEAAVVINGFFVSSTHHIAYSGRACIDEAWLNSLKENTQHG